MVGILSIQFNPKVGDKVSKFRNAFDRIGTLILKGQSVNELSTISNIIKQDIIHISIN